MICKLRQHFFYTLTIAITAVAAMLFTSCPNKITDPLTDDSGYFNVNLVLVGSEDGTPYTKEISFTDSVGTVTVETSYLLESVDIELTKEVSGASLKVNGHTLNYGSKVTVALETGTNTITVRVTPELVDPFNYTLIIKRGVAPGVVLSDDATLSSLTIDIPNSRLTPEFSSDHFEYGSIVNYLVSGILITAVSNDENADIVINGEETESGTESGPYTLGYGQNNSVVTIEVTAEDEVTVKTYTLDVYRLGAADNEAPVITLVEGSPYYLEVYSEWVEPGYSAHDSQEGDLTSSVGITGNVDTSFLGSNTLTYYVSDTSGNSTAVQRMVIIRDTTDPVITLNGSNPMRVNRGAVYVEPGAEVTDNYDTNLSCDISGSVDTAVEGIYHITYSAGDSSGNTATATRNVVVSNDNDTNPPVITLIGDNPCYHEVNTTWNDPGWTAVDTEEGNLHDSVSITGSVNVTNIGSTTLYYDVSDSSGNHAVRRSREVVVEDTTAPEISLIGSAEINVAHGSTFSDPGVLVTDNFDTGLTADVTGTVRTDIIGSYFLRYDAEDSNGNTASPKYRTVHVTDQTPPNIFLDGYSSVTVALGGTFTDPYTTGDVTATDNVDGNLTSQITISGDTVDTETPGTYHIYYDVSDSSGLEADTVTLTVTVEDQEPPVITLVGNASMEVEFGAEFNDPGADVIDNWDNNKEPWHITSPVTVDTESVGEYILTYDATDEAGNAAIQVTRTVTVLAPPDTIDPSIMLNGDSPVYVEYPNTYTDEGAIATDQRNEDPRTYNITSDIVVTNNVNYNALGTYTIHYYVEDQADPPNSASITRTVIIQDTTPPVITISGDNPLYVDYGSTFNAPAASATDNYDIPFTGAITVSGNDFNTEAALGTEYKVEYSTTDSNDIPSTATLTVVIADISGPVITITGANPATVECGDYYTDEGATATDNYDASVTVTTTNNVNRLAPETYTVEYDADDAAGNTAQTAIRTVNVVDTTPPVITLHEGDVTVEVGSDWAIQDPGYYITDNNPATLLLSPVLSGLNMNVVGTQTLVYNLSDPSGNAATTVYRTVHVVDRTIPTISLLGDNPMHVDFGSVFTDPGATAEDNYDGDISDDVVVSGDTVNILETGTYILDYNVEDSSGNDAVQQSRTVIVGDYSAPVISVLGENPVYVECLTEYTDAGATATDNRDGDITDSIITTGDSIDTSVPGSHTVTYQVSDNAGHQTTETRTVNVIDTEAPLITLTGDLSLTVEVNTDWAEWEPGYSATDNVDDDITDDVVLTNLDMSVLGIQILYYNVADSSGNNATAVSRTVTVQDTTPPVISLRPDLNHGGIAEITLSVGDTFSDPGADVEDNYDDDRIIYGNGTVDTSTEGTYTLTYNTSDNHSNSAVEVIRTVYVVEE